MSLKASPESSLFIWGLGGKRSSNCIHKWQILGHYKFFIPLVMFSAVSFQNSVCDIILSVIFLGPYCGIHTEARELHMKFWDQFQAIKPMLVWRSFLLFPPSWYHFQPIPSENILYNNDNHCYYTITCAVVSDTRVSQLNKPKSTL